MNYTTVEQLLMDETFLSWYYHLNEEDRDRWNKWIAASPENELLADKAVEWITSLAALEEMEISKVEDIPEEYVDEIWKRVLANIKTELVTQNTAITPRRRKRTHWPMMLNSYFKIAWRNVKRSRVQSAINIAGLSLGMAVTVLIGLWVWDELSFNKYHQHYDRIAQVMLRFTLKGESGVQFSLPPPVGQALRSQYGNDFERVAMMSGVGQHNLSAGDKKLYQGGNFMEPGAPDMLSLKMIKGTREGLKDPYSILLSGRVAKALFGEDDPTGRTVKIDNRIDLKVTGVYEDLPVNTQFTDMAFITPWDLYTSRWQWVKDNKDKWDFNAFSALVQLSPHANFAQVSAHIRDFRKLANLPEDKATGPYKIELDLFPMAKWHLYDEFKNGVSADGQIRYVRLFGAIGIFVLMLACINFMNLSTARSGKRAREVGIRKAIGSLRTQLVLQFLSESVLVTLFAFLLSLVIAQLTLPWFNTIAGKDMHVLWQNPWFWCIGLSFCLVTGLFAGSYPAFYLSSFRPVRVLKGTFRAGRYAALPRRILVVTQFMVSVLLIAGTVTVFRQIQYAKNRPVGYNRNGLLSLQMTTPDIYTNYKTICNELLASGVASAVSQTQGPITATWVGGGGDIEWAGKDPRMVPSFSFVAVSIEHGNTVGWQFTEGRDFSSSFATDSMGIILNESAVRYMGLRHPVGEAIRWNGKNWHVVGVIRDMIMNSPYESVYQTFFTVLSEPGNFVNIRVNPRISMTEALTGIRKVLERYNPAAPFEYRFADEEYAKKFGYEERIARLAAIFAILAIFISCLGLFGLASFMAEQRNREVSIRKVLGASVFVLWRMLTKEFAMLVFVSCIIAIPAAWYLLDKWLQQYNYRTRITWDIFAGVGLGALLIALLTVSYQTIRTALANPVKSLRSE